MRLLRLISRAPFLPALLLASFPPAVFAADAQSGMGTIAGRVFSPATGTCYARLRNLTDFHSLWTFGLKGSY